MPLRFANGGADVVKESKPKERRSFNGREYILEESIVADVAILKAWRADTLGNL